MTTDGLSCKKALPASILLLCLASYGLYVLKGSAPRQRTAVPMPVPGWERWTPGPGGERRTPSHAANHSVTNLAHVQPSPKATLYITTQPIGRLGNQMFQYASLLGIAAMNDGSHHAYVPPSSLAAQAFQLTHVENRNSEQFRKISEVGSGTFDSKFKHLPSVNVRAGVYLQSWKYFHGIDDSIRREFTFQRKIRDQGRQLWRKLTKGRGNVTTVGVHIRRGDYNRPNIVGQFKLPPLSFFHKAAAFFRARYNNTLFIVITTDRKWCQELMEAADFTLAPQASAPVHLFVLTQCDHVVVSLGSYGWWGAYLSGGDAVYYNNCVYPNITAKKGFVAADHFLPSWTGIGD